MGDLEGLPFGTYSSVARHPWTLGLTDSRYAFVFVTLSLISKTRSDTVNIEAYKLNGACVVYLDNPEMSAAVFMYSEPPCCGLSGSPVHLICCSRML